MKTRMTQKEVRAMNPVLVKYGSPAYGLLYKEYYPPIGYTCGKYGWNSDVYRAGGKVFETGYRCAAPGAVGLVSAEEVRRAIAGEPAIEAVK